MPEGHIMTMTIHLSRRRRRRRDEGRKGQRGGKRARHPGLGPRDGCPHSTYRCGCGAGLVRQRVVCGGGFTSNTGIERPGVKARCRLN